MTAREPSNLILRAQNVWKKARAEEAGVLVDAADYYLAFYEAARQAKRTILLSGWQFDSGVPIVRGDDAPPGAEVKLLPLLNELCEGNPNLQVYVLAWDFHLVFAVEREWMQKLYFQWLTNERLHFRFDETTPEEASHHQKFAVIDRDLSFLGGIDLCEERWDDRQHRHSNPLRLSQGEPAKPYHDVQAYFTGCEVADALRELFVDRWSRSEGNPLKLADSESSERLEYRPRGGLSLGQGEVALSRTDPRGPGETVREIEALFVEGIHAAESLIYIETQYFSSRAIRDAFIQRIEQRHRPALQIVVVLNVEPEAIKEELAIGLRQAKVLMQVSAAAANSKHALGIYSTRCEGEALDRPSTYIHSKLLIVDDRFFTIGSANLTNRSMGVDTELHASWEAARGSREEQELTERIKSIRVSLLAEHTGLLETDSRRAIEAFAEPDGLVERLDALTQADGARLCRHALASERERHWIEFINPQALPFDPAVPDYDDDTLGHREEHAQTRSLFIGGLSGLWEKLKPG